MAAQRSIINDGGSAKSQEQIDRETRAAELRAQIAAEQDKIRRINDLQSQITSSMGALSKTLNSFANGGHISGGKGLGSAETSSCISALSSASGQLSSVLAMHEEMLRSLQAQYSSVC